MGEEEIESPIGKPRFHQEDVVGEILGLGMEAGGAGHAMFMGVIGAKVGELGTEVEMDNVAFANQFLQLGHLAEGFGRGQSDAVMGHVVIERAEMDSGDDEITLDASFVLIGADDMNLMPLAFEEPDLIHGGDSGAVVLFAKYFTDECYNHN